MYWYILAALLLVAAVVLWRMQASEDGGKGAASAPPPSGEEVFRRWLDRPGVRAALERAVEALWALMAHRTLGGPGYLTVRLPQPGEDGAVTVTAQYPNIREALYRLALRRMPDPEALLAAGVPEALLALEPRFETESGGVVSVTVRAGGAMDPETVAGIAGRGARQEALRLLKTRLEGRFPGLEARPFGAELLLTPAREEA